MAEPWKLYEGILIRNTETFECPLCFRHCAPHKGVVLMECEHSFCKPCLVEHIINCKENLFCPYKFCYGNIQDSELKILLSRNDYYDVIERIQPTEAELTKSTFKCNNIDYCGSKLFYSDALYSFTCIRCEAVNCVKCKAVHPYLSCAQYTMVIEEDELSVNKSFIQLMIKEGAKRCPKCLIYIERISGCDDMFCTYCDQSFDWDLAIPPKI